MHAALRLGFCGQVIAVEPLPRPADDLAAPVAALGLPMQILRLTLGAADGEAMLSLPPLSGDGRSARVKIVCRCNPMRATVSLPVAGAAPHSPRCALGRNLPRTTPGRSRGHIVPG